VLNVYLVWRRGLSIDPSTGVGKVSIRGYGIMLYLIKMYMIPRGIFDLIILFDFNLFYLTLIYSI